MSRRSSRRNDSVHIRDARIDELDKVSQLLKDSYQEYQKSFPAGVWKFYLEDVMNVRSRLDDAELLVAELDGQLVGTVTLYLKASKSPQEGWPKGWAGIRLLGVHPAFRNRGIGRALMEECIQHCRRHGIPTLGLHTSQLMDVARRLVRTVLRLNVNY